jgi:hypothetical protein
MEKIQRIKELVESVEKDAVAFYEKGNKAAGTRIRNAMQQLKVIAQEVRQEITAKKNTK